MSVSFSERYIDMHEECVDLVVRIGHLPDSRMLLRQLTTQKLVLCPIYLQNMAYLKKSKRYQTIVVLWDFGKMPLFLLDAKGNLPPIYSTPFYELADGDAMLDAVIHSYGIAQLPLWMIGISLKKGNYSILIKTEGYQSPINMMWHKGKKPPKTRYI